LRFKLQTEGLVFRLFDFSRKNSLMDSIINRSAFVGSSYIIIARKPYADVDFTKESPHVVPIKANWIR